MVDSGMVERVLRRRVCGMCIEGKGDRGDRVNVHATAVGHRWPLKPETRTLNGTQGLHRSARRRRADGGT